jgi:hypothetical protein
MPPVIHMMACSRLLILAWVMMWVTTGPLFDTHLPDLPDTADGPASLQSARQKHFFYLSNQDSNFQIGIALLDDDDAKKRKVGQPSDLGVLYHLPNRPLLPNSVIESRAIPPRLLLFGTPQGPRAPPSIVSL